MWRKRTSTASPRSTIQRAIASIGVMPLPADSNSSFAAGRGAQLKSPKGPLIRRRSPTCSRSQIQFENGPPATRLMAISTRSGWVGVEASV